MSSEKVVFHFFLFCIFALITGRSCFMALGFVALHKCCVFYRLKVCGNLVLNVSAIFPAAFAHPGSLPHFGSSWNI